MPGKKAQKNAAVVPAARTFSSADSEMLEKGLLPFILHFVAMMTGKQSC